MAEGPYRALAGGVGRRSSPRPIGETGALPVPAQELHTLGHGTRARPRSAVGAEMVGRARARASGAETNVEKCRHVRYACREKLKRYPAPIVD